MSEKKFILILFFFIFQLGTFAQEVKKDTIPQKKDENLLEKKETTIPETKGEKAQEYKPYNLTQFGHETFLYVKQPVLWKGKDWLRVGVVVAGTFAIMPLDQTITDATQGKQRYYYSVPIVAGRVYGEWYSIGGVAAVFGLYGLALNNNSAKKVSIELLQGGLYAEAVTEVFKAVIGRARPTYKNDAFVYHPFTLTDDHFHSIPSGHTTSAMALSTIMSRHAHSTTLKILAYLPAAMTMFSRIYQDQHWLSDEIPAAAIGFFVGNWVVDLHEGKRHRINVTSVYPPAISVGLDWDSAQK
jgi:membrane-associated phospholipid phosphatase